MTASLEELAAARAAGARIATRHGVPDRLEAYRDGRWDGADRELPTLYVDDFSEIPFLDEILGIEGYQHRARVRAGHGDMFATITPAVDGYEEYCRERLGLGVARGLLARPTSDHLAVARACERDPVFGELVDTARRAGGLAIHPYMSIAAVWDLGARIAAASGASVTIVGSPPPVTWIANDKAAFGEVVAEVLGTEWLVDTALGSDPAQLAGHLVEFAGRHARVGLKRLRCASAMGNLVLGGAALLAMGRDKVEDLVAAFLVRTQWDGEESVQVVAWEDAGLSPSTQLWIPPAGSGDPTLDGIYEQILEGPERVFVGSRPAELPDALAARLGNASVRVAAALQELGYVGRCSFDLLVVGEVGAESRVVFTECNGRWGGTSTPMHLVDRLVGVGGARPVYRAQDYVDPRLVGMSFRELCGRVGEELFDRRTGRGRFVFYNVNPLAESGKLDVIAFGADRGEVDRAVEEGLPRLLG